ncbi:MAG: HlyC/CorC family transporter [Clostridia bacterium]|nr:HlyC/CorC family transporter [Clostridia bacterium]
MWLQIGLLVFLIGVNAFFAASEIALISLNDSKIKKMAEEGHKKARQIEKLVGEPSKFLATIQVGVTLSGFLASAVAADSFAGEITEWFYPFISAYVAKEALSGVIIVVITLILSYFTLVFGELVPKRFAMQNCEKVSMAVIGILNIVEKLSRPFVKFLTFSTNLIIKLFGGDPNATNENVTEEEIRMMVDLGEEKGTIEVAEKEMIENVFDFNNITASEVMTHRKDIIAIPINATLDEVVTLLDEEKFTRYPVYEEDIDNIIGMFHSKDIVRYIINKDKLKFSVKDVMRPIYFVPDSKMIDEIFHELQKNKMYMAAVVDEYGGTAGILTIEDLMEQIVGNIFDEYDGEEMADFTPIDENTQLVDGTVSLIEVERKFDKKLPTEDYDTLGGFIMGHLGVVPEEGDRPEFEFNGLLFKVEEIVEKRITKVKICVTGEEADLPEQEEE